MKENFSTAVIGGEGNGSPFASSNSTTTLTVGGSQGFVSGIVGTAGTGFSNHNMDTSTTNINEQ